MAVSGRKCFAVLAFTALSALCIGSAAWAQYDFDYEGGYVKPCSLQGVNPAHHPEVFGNPAVAMEYGFVRSGDGTWQVQGNCHGQPKPAVPSPSRPHRKRSGDLAARATA
jgi:hypothetical protein